ncbi:Mov34/MPN/PAD-1 family protein [Methylophilus sp. QUAN]|uniref:Mov34/MPN/PAD-1 family protein n=1 Tax=Methylophilus sp. QUAN TaxID=2781020 RepID=UPI00188FBC13|nr:Mov34/MPN/PAD-1 family protein [Methylophilus sp. QUAN]MBF4991863.1 Mov34/MPN/PAD-1 family protein [Methylophilus sp. QUAN]
MLQYIGEGRVYFQLANVSGNIDVSVIEQFKKYKQTNFMSREAGGILLGYLDLYSNGLLIEKCTVPCFGDKRTRFSFYRSNKHQKKAEKWWRETNEKGVSLGIWHTHPEPRPTPSSVDYADFKQVIAASAFNSGYLLSIIIGTEEFGVWMGDKNNNIQLVGYLPL